jgi:hypothetical protein
LCLQDLRALILVDDDDFLRATFQIAGYSSVDIVKLAGIVEQNRGAQLWYERAWLVVVEALRLVWKNKKGCNMASTLFIFGRERLTACRKACQLCWI